MERFLRISLVLVALAGMACGGTDRSTGTSSITGSAGDNTLVLVPSFSIGASDEAGVQLGKPAAIDISQDRVFILDRDFKTVRVFTKDGVQVGMVGSQGQGPGEFEVPTGMAVSQTRLYVSELGNRRLHSFSIPDGELIYTKETDVGLYGPMRGLGDGSLLAGVMTNEQYDDGTPRPGLATIAANGAIIEVTTIPDESLARHPSRVVPGANLRVTLRPPFEPDLVWNIAADGGIMLGDGAGYRIAVMSRQGTAKELVGPDHLSRAAVNPEEAAWHAAWMTAQARRADPSYTWPVEDIATHKPFFSGLFPDDLGQVWVLRSVGARRVRACTETFATPRDVGRPVKCWQDELVFDILKSDGAFIGSVNVPPDALLGPAPVTPVVAIVDGIVWLRTSRDDGNEMITGYELQPGPGN